MDSKFIVSDLVFSLGEMPAIASGWSDTNFARGHTPGRFTEKFSIGGFVLVAWLDLNKPERERK